MPEEPITPVSIVPKEAKKEKKKPDGLVIPPKKPKLSKAERRAIQEQQRAAKAAAASGGAKTPAHQAQPKPESKPAAETVAKKAAPEAKPAAVDKENTSKTVNLVSHLTPYLDPSQTFATGAELQLRQPVTGLHPAVVELGYRYATGAVRGGNARCRAMLECYRHVLEDFVSPTSSTDVRQALDSCLKASFQYWTESCRPHSVSMGNAFTFLKAAVASMERDVAYDDMKATLLDTLSAYAAERIDYADKAIAVLAVEKLLKPSEVILTFGSSEAVEAVLLQAAAEAQDFRVIVVDSRPLLEGRQLLQRLRAAGIECSYILLNALTYVMQDVTKVLLGAAALMSDGSVLGRVGTAAVALAAGAVHLPVLICSETYKISNRVQLESITGNELGNPAALAMNSPVLEDWPSIERLKLLNLRYDLTPAEFVSGIVTELGIVPPTSVAVLLREMNPQDFKSN